MQREDPTRSVTPNVRIRESDPGVSTRDEDGAIDLQDGACTRHEGSAGEYRSPALCDCQYWWVEFDYSRACVCVCVCVVRGCESVFVCVCEGVRECVCESVCVCVCVIRGCESMFVCVCEGARECVCEGVCVCVYVCV